MRQPPPEEWAPNHTPELTRGWLVDIRLQDYQIIPCCYLTADHYICCVKRSTHRIPVDQVLHVRATRYVEGNINH